jgi:hypothetical protein
MPYNLGIKPDKLKVYLYRDADFDSVLTRRDDAGALVDWGPADIRLIFPAAEGTPTWTASVIGPDATFQVDKAVTNLRDNGERVELWVGDQCWAAGTVSKKGVLA